MPSAEQNRRFARNKVAKSEEEKERVDRVAKAIATELMDNYFMRTGVLDDRHRNLARAAIAAYD